jgi:tetratricopeptide (TPR) repeat protein
VAAAQVALAFTWKMSPTASSGHEADVHFRRALEMYENLERDWPARRQPVGICLDYTADLAFQRGDTKEAERRWREAIERGEAYLKQHPDNLDARSTVCWACADVCDAILLRVDTRAAEAEPILNKGLEHVALMRQQDPRSSQAREVGAFLRFCLARCLCNTDRVDDAVPLFQQAVEEMESICADFPWNRPYWDSIQYFHREAVFALQQANRPDETRALLRRWDGWLQEIGPTLPDDVAAQAELRRCQKGLVRLLRAVGQVEDADVLERALAAEAAPELRRGQDDAPR